jgi:hypothetical protein
MSDTGAVTGTIARRLRKKTKKGPVGRKVKIAFHIMSKPRPASGGPRRGRDWHDDWPEFFEQLKALAKRYQLTIRKMD